MNSANARIAVMLVGAEADSLLSETEQTLRDIFPDCRPARFPTLADANRSARKQIWFPQLIVVCQSWPHEYSRSDVETLISNWPIARLICVYGPWCDADGRNFSVWPHASRVPYAHLKNRLRIEHEVISGKIAALPVTAGRDEVFEFNVQREPQQPQHLKVRIDIADRALRAATEAILRNAGLEVSQSGNAHVRIQDGDSRPSNSAGQHVGGIVSLQALPDPGNQRRSARFRIVSKPFANADLVEAVMQSAEAAVVR